MSSRLHGTSRVLHHLLAEDTGGWVVADADEFTCALLLSAIADGSCESGIVPDQVRELRAHGQRFAPLELAWARMLTETCAAVRRDELYPVEDPGAAPRLEIDLERPHVGGHVAVAVKRAARAQRTG